MHVDEPGLLVLTGRLKERSCEPGAADRSVDDVGPGFAVGIVDTDGATFAPLCDDKPSASLKIPRDLLMLFGGEQGSIRTLVARLGKHGEALRGDSDEFLLLVGAHRHRPTRHLNALEPDPRRPI